MWKSLEKEDAEAEKSKQKTHAHVRIEEKDGDLSEAETDESTNIFSRMKKRAKSMKRGSAQSAVSEKSQAEHLGHSALRILTLGDSDEEDVPEIDPDDDIWTVEVFKPSDGRMYAKCFVRAFAPLMWVAIALGLFPFTPHRDEDGSYSFNFNLGSFSCISFIISGFCVILTTLWTLISTACMLANIPNHDIHDPKNSTGKFTDYRSEEMFIYRRNPVSLIVLNCVLIYLSTCMISVFARRKLISKHLLYWTEMVELLQLDVGHHVVRRLVILYVVIGAFLLTIICIYASSVSPMFSGSGATIFVLLLRLFYKQCYFDPNIHIYKHFFAVGLLYCIVASFIYTIWLFFYCRVVQNILEIWIDRLQICLGVHTAHHDHTVTDTAHDQTVVRNTRANLYKDHLAIFDLIDGVNHQFRISLEIFILTFMAMMIFEAYGFIRAGFHAEFSECNHRIDSLSFALLFILHMFIFIVVILEAAGVTVTEYQVLDIVRRKGMMACKNEHELWFMMNMQLSFGSHEDVGIVGDGFFYITKAFLLETVSAMASLLIILYQFKVPFQDPNYESVKFMSLLDQIEGTGHRTIC